MDNSQAVAAGRAASEQVQAPVSFESHGIDPASKIAGRFRTAAGHALGIEIARQAGESFLSKGVVDLSARRIRTADSERDLATRTWGASVAAADDARAKVEAELEAINAEAEALAASAEPHEPPPPTNPLERLAVATESARAVDGLVAEIKLASPSQRFGIMQARMQAAIDAGDAVGARTVLESARRVLAENPSPSARRQHAALKETYDAALRPADADALLAQASGLSEAIKTFRTSNWFFKPIGALDRVVAGLTSNGQRQAPHIAKRARAALVANADPTVRKKIDGLVKVAVAEASGHDSRNYWV